MCLGESVTYVLEHTMRAGQSPLFRRPSAWLGIFKSDLGVQTGSKAFSVHGCVSHQAAR
jgi:hypothetical protein